MGNLATSFRLIPVRGGVELQGIAKSDRGSKYILDSVVILFEEGQQKATKEQLEAAVRQLDAQYI